MRANTAMSAIIGALLLLAAQPVDGAQTHHDARAGAESTSVAADDEETDEGKAEDDKGRSATERKSQKKKRRKKTRTKKVPTIAKSRTIEEDGQRLKVSLHSVQAKGLVEENVEKRFRRLTNGFDQCIKRSVRMGHRTVGRVQIWFSVAGTGRIFVRSTRRSSVDPRLAKCIGKKVMSVSRLQVPTKPGAAVKVVYEIEAVAGSSLSLEF